MIRRIWLQIFSILFLIITPMMAIQYVLQRESLELVFALSKQAAPDKALDSYLGLLKDFSKVDPDHAEKYKEQFEKAAETKIARQDMDLIREKLSQDVMAQIIRNTLIVLSISVCFSFWIAKHIVAHVQRLIRENQMQSARLERLGSLEAWQRVARVLVHELRAPVTPIKLISTDIEAKHRSLNHDAFTRYLREGADLIRSQIATIESMTENFMKFAKLPEVNKKALPLGDFLRKFFESYRDFEPEVLHFVFQPPQLARDTLAFDPTLLNQALFNLLKNAVEANRGRRLTVTLSCRQSQDKTSVFMANDGRAIPQEIVGRIFEPYMTSKGSANFGLGLTIAKKIALDHGGDLLLEKNSPTEGVVFELELANS